MANIKQRVLLFLILCMGVRSLFVIIAKYINTKYLKYLGYLALLLAIGFMYIYLSGTKETDLGAFGGVVWWNNLRPIHSILYLLFAYNAIIGNTSAWVYLLVDVVFGFLSFVIYYYMKGNFSTILKV